MMKLSILPLLFALSTAALPAQQTTYLKLDQVTVPGSTLPHLDELRVTSLETDETVAVSYQTGGTLVAGKASFANMKVTTGFNPSTNAILGLRAAMSTHIASGELRFYDANNQVVSKMELGDILVSSVKVGGADADVSEAIELAFSRIRWWATPPGSTLKIISGWDITKNVQW